MMYFSSEARQSAIANIRKRIDDVMATPCDHLGYIEGREIVQYLNMLIKELEREERDTHRREQRNRSMKPEAAETKLIGKRVTITDKESVWSDGWGIIQGFDGEQYSVAMYGDNACMPIFKRSEFRVHRGQ